MNIKALKLLPQFKIHSIKDEGVRYILIGTFNHLNGINNERGWLFNIDSWKDSIFVYQKTIDALTGMVNLSIDHDEYKLILKPDNKIPYIDEYWGPKDIAIALDESMNWQKTVFKSKDAIKFKLNGVIGWQEVGAPLPERAEYIGIIKKGWDHEHCYYCNEKINQSHNEYGYKNEDDIWVCENCFSEYIQPHNLSFIL